MTTEKSFIGEFSGAIMQIAEEKGIEKDRVVEIVEAALAAAYKKEYGERGQNVVASFDVTTGTMAFTLVKEVVDETTRDFTVREDDENDNQHRDNYRDDRHDHRRKEVAVDDERIARFNDQRDITLADAQKEKADAQIGDEIVFELPTKTDFGRVAAQTAKQVVMQRIREAEREAMFEEYRGREGEIVNATVQRVEGRNVYVELGKAVGMILPSEQVPGERYNPGMRVKVYIAGVSEDTRGDGITLSRIHPELVRRLFELEVPEIFAGTVQLKAIAREAGSRVKIAVATEDESIDPIGSCVGQRGTRVQAIIDELNGEKIDIIEYKEDEAKFIAAALSPAKVLGVTLNTEKKTATAIVPDDQLSLAIGKRGQNVRLAVKLTGWDIDVVGAGAANDVDDDNDNDDVAGDGVTVPVEDTEESTAPEEEIVADNKKDKKDKKEKKDEKSDNKDATPADDADNAKDNTDDSDEKVAPVGAVPIPA